MGEGTPRHATYLREFNEQLALTLDQILVLVDELNTAGIDDGLLIFGKVASIVPLLEVFTANQLITHPSPPSLILRVLDLLYPGVLKVWSLAVKLLSSRQVSEGEFHSLRYRF